MDFFMNKKPQVKRMNQSFRLTILALAVLVSTTVTAQDKRNMFNPVNTSVTSQTIAPDARAAGMGDVGAATDPDVNSQYWNPAKYPFNISRAGVSLNYTPWLRQLVSDIDLAYLAGYYRIGDYSAVSASMRYFSLGEVQSNDGSALTINPYEMSFDVAYSLMLSEHFSWELLYAGFILTLLTILRMIHLPVQPLLPTSHAIIRII